MTRGSVTAQRKRVHWSVVSPRILHWADRLAWSNWTGTAGRPDRIRATAEGWADRVDTVTATCPDRDDLAALPVRPDGYIAWAADPTPDLGRTDPMVRPDDSESV
jgi:hypothetical protein